MILNVQTNLNQIIPDTIRERKEEKKKTDKIYHPDHSIVDRTSNKIQEPFQNRPYTQCTISKRARYDIGGTRPPLQSCGTGSRSIPQSLVDDRHPRFGERAVASRFMARFTPVLCLTIGLLSSHRPSALSLLLLLSCRSDRPRRLFSP